MIKYDFINSSSDGLKIELAYTIPKEEIKGIVPVSYTHLTLPTKLEV